MKKNQTAYYDVVAFSGVTPQSGSAVRIRSLCSELARRGLKVLLVERGRKSDKSLVRAGLTHLIFPTAGMPPMLDLVVSTLLGLRTARRCKCSMVLALKPLPPSVMPALLLKNKGALAVIDVDDLDYEFHPAGMARKACLRWFRKYPGRFDRVATHNQLLAGVIADVCCIDAARIVQLGQGIELDGFLKASPDEALRRRLGLDGKKIAAYAASLGLTTDFGKILPWLAEFVGDGRKRAVLVLGGGAREAEFRQMAADLAPEGSIVFTGQIDHGEVPRHLSICRVGFNYMGDNLVNQCRVPIKAREYLAAGLPLVCNRVGAVPELNDSVFFYSDFNEITGMLESALSLEPIVAQRSGREWVKKYCDWKNIVNDFLAALPPIKL